MNETHVLSLCAAYREYFPIGAAVSLETVRTHRELILSHFNSLTAENEMKPVSVHPEEGVYAFDAADTLAEFARTAGMRMRGHTLVWHNQVPQWFFRTSSGGAASKELVLSRMSDHIRTVAGRYRGTVYCWDVVNEAVSDDEEFLRHSPWTELTGDAFIRKAFETAHEADPAARLFYNDYNAVRPDKREKIIRLVKSLKDSGTPIHGIGLQGHWNICTPQTDEIREALDRYAELGLELQITELDVSLFRFEDHRTDLTEPPEELLERQAQFYERLFALLRGYRQVVTGVTFWGAADDRTWLDDFPVRGRKNWPLMFDTGRAPKEAFFRITGFLD